MDNYTISYKIICSHCGNHVDPLYSFCPNCGRQIIKIDFNPQKTGWMCPKCGRCHSPHINTCPYCSPYMAPYQPYQPYYPQPYYPPWEPYTITYGADSIPYCTTSCNNKA